MFDGLIKELFQYYYEPGNFTDHDDWENLIEEARKLSHLDSRIIPEIKSCKHGYKHKDFDDLLRICTQLVIQHNPNIILDRKKFIKKIVKERSLLWGRAGSCFEGRIVISNCVIRLEGHIYNYPGYVDISVGNYFTDKIKWDNMREFGDLLKSDPSVTDICRSVRTGVYKRYIDMKREKYYLRKKNRYSKKNKKHQSKNLPSSEKTIEIGGRPGEHKIEKTPEEKYILDADKLLDKDHETRYECEKEKEYGKEEKKDDEHGSGKEKEHGSGKEDGKEDRKEDEHGSGKEDRKEKGKEDGPIFHKEITVENPIEKKTEEICHEKEYKQILDTKTHSQINQTISKEVFEAFFAEKNFEKFFNEKIEKILDERIKDILNKGDAKICKEISHSSG